jgi:hypothetical protein
VDSVSPHPNKLKKKKEIKLGRFVRRMWLRACLISFLNLKVPSLLKVLNILLFLHMKHLYYNISIIERGTKSLQQFKYLSIYFIYSRHLITVAEDEDTG